MPAERAGAALRGLELADEPGLGGDPRLVELVGRRDRRRARAPDRRARRPSSRAIAARAVADSTNRPGSRSAWTCAYAPVAELSRSRSRRGSRADSLWPSRIAATSSAATSGWRAAARESRRARYASLTSRCDARPRAVRSARARRSSARARAARRHRAEPALDAAPHARRIDVAGDDERHVVGDVVAAEEVDELALAEPLHALGRADHRPPIRMRGERRREQALRDVRAGSSLPWRISSRITWRSRASSSGSTRGAVSASPIASIAPST